MICKLSWMSSILVFLVTIGKEQCSLSPHLLNEILSFLLFNPFCIVNFFLSHYLN